MYFVNKLGDQDLSPTNTTCNDSDDLDSFLTAIWAGDNDDLVCDILSSPCSFPSAPRLEASTSPEWQKELSVSSPPAVRRKRTDEKIRNNTTKYEASSSRCKFNASLVEGFSKLEQSLIDSNAPLLDVQRHIVYLVHDQQGAKYIQMRLHSYSREVYEWMLKTLSPHLARLSAHVFGNHVVQKLLEIGTPEDRSYICRTALTGNVVDLASHAYGCRVLQKALDYVTLPDRLAICTELQPSVIRLIEDQNGNHVIQKAVDKLPHSNSNLIVDACLGEVVRISLHCYGCRVMQRILEHCAHSCTGLLLNELTQGVPVLIKDQFGNYVVQHLLRYGRQRDKQQVVNLVVKNILAYACHKYASNVVERCLEPYVPINLRKAVVVASFDNSNGKPPILAMVRDPYANYVVQRILASDLIDLDDPDRWEVLYKLQKHLPALRKFTYGRHIVEGIERLRRQIAVRSH